MTDVQQGSTEDLRGEMAERAMEPAKVGLTIEDELRSLQGEFDKALPPGDLTSLRFIRTVITELRKKPDLRSTERASLLGAVMTAAQLGLEFPLDEAYLVPFKDHGVLKTQLIVSYKGYISLARRSGEIKDIVAREIHERDTYRVWSDENGDHMLHEPYMEGDHQSSDRGAITRYFGRVRYTNGGVFIQDMSIEDIMARAKRSANFNSTRSPWKSDYDAMCRKSVIRAMVPFLPLDASVAEYVGADEQVVRRMPDATLVREYPDPSDEQGDQDDGVMEGQVISPERREAEATLERMITSQSDRRAQDAAQRWLLKEFDAIPKLDDERLAAATRAMAGWLEDQAGQAQNPPESANSSPTVPANGSEVQTPQEPPSGDPGSSGGVQIDPVDQEVLDETRAILETVPEDKRFTAQQGVQAMDGRAVNRALAQRQLKTRGTLSVRRALLAAKMAQEALADESADPTEGLGEAE